MKFEYTEITNIGGRSNNEDSMATVSLSHDKRILIVADGAGGHEAGEVASQLFCKEAVGLLKEKSSELLQTPVPTLTEIFTQLNETLATKLTAKGKGKARTTAVVGLCTPTMIATAHAGDSRAMCFNTEEMIWQTKDHNMLQEMIDIGTIKKEEAQNYNIGNIITSCLPRSASDFKLAVGVYEPLGVGECLLLCSDGLTDKVSENDLHELAGAKNIKKMLKNLVKKITKENSGCDNITVQMIRRTA